MSSPNGQRCIISSIDQPADLADAYRVLIADLLAENPERRGQLGQFFTPEAIARYLASWVTPRTQLSILDAGAGVGSLSAACVEAALQWSTKPSHISVTAFEIDDNILPFLRSTLNECAALCATQGIEFDYQIELGDFIDKAARLVSGQHTLFEGSQRWDIAILNPPYRKINIDSSERLALRRVGIETSNIYAGFLWLTSKLLNVDGELIAITPRSFCNGPYFLPFRKALVKDFYFERIHIYDTRDRAFGEDEVLQENILFKIKHLKDNLLRQSVETIVSSSTDPLSPISERSVDHVQIVNPSDPERFIHVTPSISGEAVRSQIEALPNDLPSLGITVSTGRVVDFRTKAALQDRHIAGQTVPLIYPLHIADGFVRWPIDTLRKPNAITHNTITADLLIPSGNYVLVKRFSAKEERKRIVAGIYDPDRFELTEWVGIENHLNYYHQAGQGLSASLSRGLALYLNASAIDQYFRQFNGHTQVNATDLRKLRYPSRQQLEALGAYVNGKMPTQEAIDDLIFQQLQIQSQIMPKTNSSQTTSKGNSRIAKRIKEALDVLKQLNLPREQQNERSALTLLALLDMKPQTGWSKATAPLRGITEIMDYVRDYYAAKYAPNTRETFRRFTMHQFVQAGLVLHNPDNPQRPTNSPDNCYQIEPSALALIQTYDHSTWADHLSKYFSQHTALLALHAREREMTLVPVKLPDGSEVQLSGGGQNTLIKKIIEDFCSRFTPGGTVLYLGDAGKKLRGSEVKSFARLGITINEHGKMPDVVIHFTQKDWLVVIEAVTSHGPINVKRHNELTELFAGSSAGVVYVTAFDSRNTMMRYINEIAWETEIWIADNPSHLIHLNGERFMGPYKR